MFSGICIAQSSKILSPCYTLLLDLAQTFHCISALWRGSDTQIDYEKLAVDVNLRDILLCAALQVSYFAPSTLVMKLPMSPPCDT